MPLDRLKPRSDSAIVRNMLDDIERSLKAGALRQDVWKTLRDEHGLKLEFGSFTKALLRARRNREKEQQGAKSPAPVAVETANASIVACAIQTDSGSPELVDCAIQPDTIEGASVPVEKPSEPVPVPKKPRIRTAKDRENVPPLDFSDLDDRYK